jgi:hypothetical protein
MSNAVQVVEISARDAMLIWEKAIVQFKAEIKSKIKERDQLITELVDAWNSFCPTFPRSDKEIELLQRAKEAIGA